jgi:exodeoxyribonuclease VII small subunit
MATNPKKTDEPNFEDSLKRLEAIVGEMETGALSLEDMMSRFEEGTGLVKFCTGKLDEVEQKIEKLVKQGDEIVTEPFAAEEE